MKTIPLTQGKVAFVDDADYDRVMTLKWFARKTKNSWYACHTTHPARQCVYMHRFILESPTGTKTDHRDGNRLNNQRDNIRICTTRQNSQSYQKPYAGRKSPFRGVHVEKAGKWRARIKANGKEIHIGTFVTTEAAARAYDREARRYFGEWAQLNFPAAKESPAEQTSMPYDQ